MQINQNLFGCYSSFSALGPEVNFLLRLQGKINIIIHGHYIPFICLLDLTKSTFWAEDHRWNGYSLQLEKMDNLIHTSYPENNPKSNKQKIFKVIKHGEYTFLSYYLYKFKSWKSVL